MTSNNYLCGLPAGLPKSTTRQLYDANKVINEDKTETIAHEVGNSESKDHSTSGISANASLSIYQHYNPTNRTLEAAPKKIDNNGGMAHAPGIVEPTILIKLEGNKKAGISNHANQITNIFVHEKQHDDDYIF